MPVMDEFKEERDAIKNGSFKDKLKYFWYYYKAHTLITLFVLFLIFTLVHDIVTQKDDAFFAVLLNSATVDEEKVDSLIQNYAEYAEIDTKEYDIVLDNTINFSTVGDNSFEAKFSELTMSASQRLLAYTASGNVDVIIANSEMFPNQAVQGMFGDLREILNAEQIEKYEPYFYYVDQAYLDAIAIAEETLSLGEELDPSLAIFPDPLKPEEMEEPVPIGLLITDCPPFSETYWFGGEFTVLGIMVNAPHLEDSVEFIDYLFE